MKWIHELGFQIMDGTCNICNLRAEKTAYADKTMYVTKSVEMWVLCGYYLFEGQKKMNPLDLTALLQQGCLKLGDYFGQQCVLGRQLKKFNVKYKLYKLQKLLQSLLFY